MYTKTITGELVAAGFMAGQALADTCQMSNPLGDIDPKNIPSRDTLCVP